jgi:hypothetical protein
MVFILRGAAFGIGALVFLVGIVATTEASGFLPSVVFWAIAACVVVSLGLGLANRTRLR